MGMLVYVLKHPTMGYFLGYERTWFLQRFRRSPRWGEQPIFNYNVSMHRTFEGAREFLMGHPEFPPETGIVEYLWE